MELREKVKANASDEELQATIDKQIAIIYNIVATCLGIIILNTIYIFENFLRGVGREVGTI